MAKTSSKKAPTKSEVLNNIAEATDLPRAKVNDVFNELAKEIGKAIGKRGPGQFAIPGICKIVVQRKPAQPARKNVPNPFKPGEMMDVAAKPARNVVKVRPLKSLKDMVK
jgi:nucleoid DNA-binding protein